MLQNALKCIRQRLIYVGKSRVAEVVDQLQQEWPDVLSVVVGNKHLSALPCKVSQYFNKVLSSVNISIIKILLCKFHYLE